MLGRVFLRCSLFQGKATTTSIVSSVFSARSFVTTLSKQQQPRPTTATTTPISKNGPVNTSANPPAPAQPLPPQQQQQPPTPVVVARPPKNPKAARKKSMRGWLPIAHTELGEGHRYPCVAFARADSFDQLNKLQAVLSIDYKLQKLPERESEAAFFSLAKETSPSADAAIAEPATVRKDFVVFWDGVVVFWNCTKLEQSNILRVLKPFERNPHAPELVESEAERVAFQVADGPPRILGETFILNDEAYTRMQSKSTEADPLILTKFTFSEALRLSVRLAIWESQLVHLAENVESTIEDLRQGRTLRVTRGDVLRRCGDLLMFRHRVNLASDMLDIPNFYWDRPQLEDLFKRARFFLNVPQRTRLVNEKLNHCFELVELLRSHLNDNHHSRLEWLIILLIMIEVIFDAIPTLSKFIFDE